MSRMHMAKYVPDNNVATGMGGLLMSNPVKTVAMAFAQKYRKYLVASMAVAEADAAGNELPPGRITELFSQARAVPTVSVLKDLSSGHVNPRRAANVEVTGAYEGKDKATGFPKSSPVTIEFGSHYNEGTKRDRPSYHVMLNALRAQAAATRGMDLAKDAT